MSFKNNFSYLLLNISILKVLAVISVVDKGIMPLEKNSVALKFFVDIENENRDGACEVYSRVKKCCLTDLDKEDCDIMNLFGESISIVKPRDRKTLMYVFPTMYQHDLIGYCDVVVDYQCFRNRDRLRVNIPFDTRIFRNRRSSPLLTSFLSSITTESCETLDQNPLENCMPVDCDLKYAGQRSFYDNDIKRCIKAPVCIGGPTKNLPSVVYVPHINICKDLELPLTMQDIYAISTGLGTVNQSTKKEEHAKMELESNCSTISQNLCLLRDLMYGKLCPCDKAAIVNFKDGCKSAMLTIVFCVLSICAVILSFIFCVNTTIWIHKQWLKGNINALMLRIRSKFKRTRNKRHRSRVNSEIRNSLLREVIVKDIPLELRGSAISICDRMNKEVRKKKRYLNEDIGSQISLEKGSARTILNSSSSSDTVFSEKQPFLK